MYHLYSIYILGGIMKEKLKELLKNAYSPYYHFHVSAIVVTKDGQEFEGVNVENANGTSICAERNAIAHAVAKGYKKGDFKQIYIMLENGKIGYPCFACRQVLLEFLEKDTPVTIVGFDKEETHTLKELCPYPFDEEDLK
jgi:cytidine deaminase